MIRTTQAERVHGFELAYRESLPLLEAEAYELRHEATGARLLHFATDDAENHLSAAIPVRVDDDTGWTHVLEHCVFYARSRYYSRGEMRQGRRWLATHKGAWTGPDFTHYGLSTPDARAFGELIDLLCDQLFEPELDDEVFWNQVRLDLAEAGDPSGPLTYRGIIYNEQKGLAALGLVAAWDALVSALFPGSDYRHASGGHFLEMPRLTPERLRANHRKHYRPAAARFVSWGPAPLDDIAAAFDRALSRVPNGAEPAPELAAIPVVEQPAMMKVRLPSTPEAAGADRQVVVGWATVDWTDAFDVFLHDVAVEALLRHRGSPLRAALLESGAGDGLADTLYDYGWRPARHVFATGLRGAGEEQVEAIVELVCGSLRGGIDRELLGAALRRLELRRRLAQPDWSAAMLTLTSVLPAWVLGADPLGALRWDELTRRLHAEPGALDDFVATRLLSNPQRAAIVVEPDPEGVAKLLERERAALQGAGARLGAAGRTEVAEAAGRVAERTRAEAAELAAAPPPATDDLDGGQPEPDLPRPPLLAVRRGVAHLELTLGLGDLEPRLVPLLGPLTAAAERAAADIGLRVAIEAPSDAGRDLFYPLLRLSATALEREADALRERLAEAIDRVELAPADVAQARAAAAGSLFFRAAELTWTLAAAGLRASAAFLDEARGFRQLELAATERDLEALQAALRGAATPRPLADAPLGAARSRARTWTQPASFNAQVYRTPGVEAPETAALAVAAAYLHELVRAEVQVAGTAYHAGVRLELDAGCFVLWSVRDPNVERTYEAFDRALEGLRRGEIDDRRLRQARASAWVSAAGDLDLVARARRASLDRLRGIAAESWTTLRERILAVDAAALQAAAQALGEAARASLGPAWQLEPLRGSLFEEVR